MHAEAYKTHKVTLGENMEEVLDRYLPRLENGDIVAITSKVVSLCQRRVVEQSEGISKSALIAREAEWFLETAETGPHPICLTIKEGILIPSAGIDESNAQGVYVLWPKSLQETATHIWIHLRERDALTDLGVIITDSQTRPLRWGVTGVGLAWCGFSPLYDRRGASDIWGNTLRVTMVNVLDALSACAVFVMGESDEQTPLAVIKNAPHMQFLSHPPTADSVKALRIDRHNDLYAPLLQSATWHRGGSASMENQQSACRD